MKSGFRTFRKKTNPSLTWMNRMDKMDNLKISGLGVRFATTSNPSNL